MPKNYSINDMNLHLLGLNMVGQAAYHAVAATFSDKGLKAAFEELGSLFDNADDNAIKGACVAIAVGIYLLAYNATQGKGCNPAIFHPKHMQGALAAMLGYFGQSFFVDYWARLSCHIVDNFSRGMAMNTIVGTVGNFFIFHLLTFKSSFAADKKVALESSFGAAFAMSAVMLADYFSIDSQHQPEKSILRATFASIGAGAGSVVGYGIYRLYSACCNGNVTNKNTSVPQDQETLLLVNTEDDDDEDKNKCCVM